MYMIDPSLQNLSKREEEIWKDAEGRATYASMLITDQLPGMLDLMTEQTYPGQKGNHPEFGDEILDIVKRLD